MKRAIALLVLALLAESASAQNIRYVQAFDTQILLYSKQGVVTGCGVRFIGISESLDQSVDAAVTISRGDESSVFSVAKFLAFTIEGKDTSAPTVRPVAVRQGWIRAKQGKAVVPLAGPMKGDDGKSALYGIKSNDAADLLLAVAKREAFLIAIALEGSEFERVYSGPLKLSERDADALAGCLTELVL